MHGWGGECLNRAQYTHTHTHTQPEREGKRQDRDEAKQRHLALVNAVQNRIRVLSERVDKTHADEINKCLHQTNESHCNILVQSKQKHCLHK